MARGRRPRRGKEPAPLRTPLRTTSTAVLRHSLYTKVAREDWPLNLASDAYSAANTSCSASGMSEGAPLNITESIRRTLGE